jgi:hypothetical protein
MDLAGLALPTLTAEFWTEDRTLNNLDAKVTELADLAQSTPIALPPSLTVELTEAATIALLLENLAVDLTVVKYLTKSTATLLPTSV